MTGERIQDVNIPLGDDVSKMMYAASQQTHGNRPGLLVEFHESFAGTRAIPLEYFGSQTKGVYINIGFDGVGTKVEAYERIGKHFGAAFDLFAMTCDDAAVRGAEPIAIGSILDVRQLSGTKAQRDAMQQLAEGYIAAAKAAGVVIVNGEIAELGNRIGGFRSPISIIRRLSSFVMHSSLPDNDLNYNWGATVLWAAHKDRLLTGKQMKPGDIVVGLEEKGFRSNGITDVRIALAKAYGKQWHRHSFEGQNLGELVGTPSTIYSRIITELNGGFRLDKTPEGQITGVAHITGGGQPSKIGRMLAPSGLGITIDAPMNPPKLMTHVQKLRGFDDTKALSKWHFGPGMVVTTPEPEDVIRVARKYGINAEVIGIVDTKPGIRIESRGAKTPGAMLFFPPEPKKKAA